MLDRIVTALAPVEGVRAIVLGGSRGRGTADAHSDYDIGLYYRGDLDIAALNSAADALNDPGVRAGMGGDGPLMTARGGWGEWVDGGGWLQIGGEPVDILYRDLDRVDRIIDDVGRGAFTIAYHYGHPHGFASHIYAGEIATAQALHDPEGIVAAAKARLVPYPPALAEAIVRRFSDEARFFLAVAKKPAARGDIADTLGCAYRALACLMQVVFAQNGEWLINEKGALKLADGFDRTPDNLRATAESALTQIATGRPDAMTAALAVLGGLMDAAGQPG